MTHLLDFLQDRVLLCDGPMGTQVQGRSLDIEHDFHGHENCTDMLTESRPDLVRELHLAYLRAGCDAAVAVSDQDALRAVADLSRLGVSSGPSGAATLAGTRGALTDPGRRAALGLDQDAVVVLLSTEGHTR